MVLAGADVAAPSLSPYRPFVDMCSPAAAAASSLSSRGSSSDADGDGDGMGWSKGWSDLRWSKRPRPSLGAAAVGERAGRRARMEPNSLLPRPAPWRGGEGGAIGGEGEEGGVVVGRAGGRSSGSFSSVPPIMAISVQRGGGGVDV
jgi:hypothetical protein